MQIIYDTKNGACERNRRRFVNPLRKNQQDTHQHGDNRENGDLRNVLNQKRGFCEMEKSGAHHKQMNGKAYDKYRRASRKLDGFHF